MWDYRFSEHPSSIGTDGKKLCQGTHVTDGLTRASMPFHMALSVSEGGHNPLISLAGDTAFCIQDLVIENVKGVGMPLLKSFLKKF